MPKLQMRIITKLPIVIILLTVCSVVATGVLSFMHSEEALQKAAYNQLAAVREGRKAELERYLDTIKYDLINVATSSMAVDGVNKLQAQWKVLQDKTNAKEYLQNSYITKNPNQVGERHKLDNAGDGSGYSEVHNSMHPWFRSFLENAGYYDVFLVNSDGDVVYSVFKELDYATNLLTGEYKKSSLARVFKDVQKASDVSEVSFQDFKPYAASNGAAASFIGAPIIDEGGEFNGALIFQMPIDRINAIMQQTVGMGESGESYVVGADHLMRTNSRFSEESTILTRKVDTHSVKMAMQGQTGVDVSADYRGVDVVSAYAPLNWMGTRWAILSEIDWAEVEAPTFAMRDSIAMAALIILAIVGCIGTLSAFSIVRPIREMVDAMRGLSKGEWETEIKALGRRDEIGEMAKALHVFKSNGLEMVEMRAEQLLQEQRQEELKRETMNQVANDFEQSVGSVVTRVASVAIQMQSSANSMSDIARTAGGRATDVAAAAGQASANVQTVATAADELTASISEISRQANQASTVTSKAITKVEQTNLQVEGLSTAVLKIGEVAVMIEDIAAQTNMLALNATIEAARAGHAGKGFAVVANEVKELANQTSTATEEISVQIKSVQTETRQAINDIHEISNIVREMDEITECIAAAVEEQNAATSEISRNIEEAAVVTENVSNNIVDVSQAAGNAEGVSSEVVGTADALSMDAEALQKEVMGFLNVIRSA